jgi:pheromone a factor receptor
MRHPEFLAAAGLASVLILIPLPAQVRVHNVALLVLIVGTFFINVISIVNTLVWAGNVRDVAPVWCDIGKSPLSPAKTSFDHWVVQPQPSRVCTIFRP